MSRLPGDQGLSDQAPSVLQGWAAAASEDTLKELEALEEAATPGPWWSWNEEDDGLGGESFIQSRDRSVEGDNDIYAHIRVAGEWHKAAKADQDFIAASRNALPALIREIRRLRADSEGR